MGEVIDLRRWKQALEPQPFYFVYNAYKSLRDHPNQDAMQERMSSAVLDILANRPIGQRLRFFYNLLNQRAYALASGDRFRINELENEIFEYNMHILG